ncbi:Nramp family divalent metal transporter [Actinomycetospora sp. TBRC 11914]|uniref:Nramp family divalent metal transporter n=1 Tax=Actinomycetospora sp. TBRC 11914 TaxID=2729387 RepID=UPI00145D2C47|nr:Nramp family divalent metal transporter [Actinomycetospora sp. TBRC 11914]NMO93965.1 Nramp family divalent metal transporter [Actinomycetospora sp. TBRC 11914]
MFRRPPVVLAGPAFVASVAYVDPGNVATNSVAGATSGYALAWVVVAAGLMAMPVQYVAAKVGIVTGRSLPRACRQVMPKPVRVLMWLQAEVVAMATDVAEFLGAAVGLNLLFGLGLLPSGLITAVVAFGVLALQRRGHRPFEVGIVAFLAFVVAGVGFQLASVGIDPGGVATGLVPGFDDSGQLVLAVGIVGATVMPHAIYAHSALTAGRSRGVGRPGRARLLRFQRTEVIGALTIAGLVNLAMLLVAARVFGAGPAGEGVDGLEAAHAGLGQLAGGAVALAFAATLLASGLSSAAVGTYSGQVVMEGFVDVRLSPTLRRSITMLPALAILAIGTSPTTALVGSQVVLSFGIPFALYALLRVARDEQVLGTEAIGRGMSLVLGAISAVVICLNVVLLVDTITG